MNKKPLVQYGWLRALLFVLLGFPLTFVIGFSIDLLLNGVYAYDYAVGVVPITSYLQDYLMKFSGFILIIFLFRIVIDKSSFYSLGFEWKRFQTDAWTGFFTALMILFVGSLILVSTQHLYFTNAFFNSTQFFAGVALFISVAFIEELVFRGYLLNNLLQSINKWWALILTSVLFAVLHLNNNNINLLSVLNVFIAGLVLGINYIHTRNLLFAIFFHFGWNFFQGSVLGYNVSGIETGSCILQQKLIGSQTLTGGAFGFEGSVICTILLLAVFIVFAVRYHKQKPLTQN